MGAQIVQSVPASGIDAGAMPLHDAATGSNGRSHQLAIPALRLDDIVHRHVNLLKMDCQGCGHISTFLNLLEVSQSRIMCVACVAADVLWQTSDLSYLVLACNML